MKKDFLLMLYEQLPNNTFNITNSLQKIKELKGNSENIFYSLCMDNIALIELYNGQVDTDEEISDISNTNLLEKIIFLSESIGGIDDEEERNNVYISVNNLLNNEKITSNIDLNEILDTVLYLLDMQSYDLFDCNSDEDVEYYKSFITKEYLRFINSIPNVDINKLYDHQVEEIRDSYFYLIDDLRNSDSYNQALTFNEVKANRISYFIDIISDKEIYELDDDKFLSVLDIIKEITNIEELKKIKKVIKFYKILDKNKFDSVIDNYSNELNDCTINRILKDIKYKVVHDDEKNTAYIYRKSNDPKKELDIVKKVLKQ